MHLSILRDTFLLSFSFHNLFIKIRRVPIFHDVVIRENTLDGEDSIVIESKVFYFYIDVYTCNTHTHTHGVLCIAFPVFRNYVLMCMKTVHLIVSLEKIICEVYRRYYILKCKETEKKTCSIYQEFRLSFYVQFKLQQRFL